MSRIGRLIKKNPVIEKFADLSGGKRLALFGLGIAVAAATTFWIRTTQVHGAQSILAILFYVFGGILSWNSIIASLAKTKEQRGILSNLIVALAIISIVGSALALPDGGLFEEGKLLATSVSPDGLQIAEGYAYAISDDGSYLGKVFVGSTNKSQSQDYILKQVFSEKGLHTLELVWEDSNTLLVNGQLIEVS